MFFFCSSNEAESQLVYCTNSPSASVETLRKGVYTLSNERLDSPWAKQREGRKIFEKITSEADRVSKETLANQLLDFLCDTTR